MPKLYRSPGFGCKTPKSLQRKVFFDVMYQLCRRGQENVRELRKSDFVTKQDERGVEKLLRNVKTRNRRESDESQEGRII